MNLEDFNFEAYHEAYRTELNKLEDPNRSPLSKKLTHTMIQKSLWKDLDNDGFTDDEIREAIDDIQDILIKINKG